LCPVDPGALINGVRNQGLIISISLLVIFVIVVALWDTSMAGPTRAPTPTRTAATNLAMTWLVAGLFAGLVSGACPG